MDRASDSGSEGWGFESLPVYQTNKRDTRKGIPLICFALRAGRDSNIQMQQSGGLLLMPGSTGMTPLFLPIPGQKRKRVPFGVPNKKEDTHTGICSVAIL